jgi:putative transposase
MEKKKLVSREELKKFIKENNITTAEDVQDVLRDLFAETLQEMLEAEMDTNLGYEKNDSKNKTTPNRRNGHSRKSVRSEYGDIDLKIPRDREGDFEPLVVKTHQKSVTGIEDQILALYAKGVSTREIQDHL